LHQFAAQVLQFEVKLPGGGLDLCSGQRCGDFVRIEVVTAPGGFGLNFKQVSGNSRSWVVAGTKSG
jgi:hypothetical protein